MSFFTSKRVAVCGMRSGLGPGAAEFCEVIGKQLALNSNIILINRGIKHSDRIAKPDDFSAEYYIISAALRHIAREHHQARIETFVNTNGENALFFEGRILPVRGKSTQARRFNFMSKVDALIAVSG